MINAGINNKFWFIGILSVISTVALAADTDIQDSNHQQIIVEGTSLDSSDDVGKVEINLGAGGNLKIKGDSQQGAGGIVVNTSSGGGLAITGFSSQETVPQNEAADQTDNIVNTDMSHQNLTGHNFAGRELVNVTLVAAVLQDSDFSNASLVNVDMTDADLRGANFASASLVNVSLSNALLDGAQWTDGRTCKSGSIGVCR